MKPCAKCGGSDLYANGRCRPCARARVAAWRKENDGRWQAQQAQYRTENKDAVRARKIAHRLSNIEHDKARKAAYYRVAKDQELARSKAWRDANKGRLRAYQAAAYCKNADEIKARVSAYRKANPEVGRRAAQRRRARAKQVGGRLTAGITTRLLRLQRGRCACCALPLGRDYHLDHIIPLALGGPNTDENVQLLRRSCNHRKAAKHPVEYMQSRGYLL